MFLALFAFALFATRVPLAPVQRLGKQHCLTCAKFSIQISHRDLIHTVGGGGEQFTTDGSDPKDFRKVVSEMKHPKWWLRAKPDLAAEGNPNGSARHLCLTLPATGSAR